MTWSQLSVDIHKYFLTKSNTSHIITELGLIDADQCTRERRSDQGPVDVKTIPLITGCISGTRPIIALIKYSILRTVKQISFWCHENFLLRSKALYPLSYTYQCQSKFLWWFVEKRGLMQVFWSNDGGHFEVRCKHKWRKRL